MEDCSTDEWLRQETLCRRQWMDKYVERPDTLSGLTFLEYPSDLLYITCHTGSDSVTYHPTQVIAPHLQMNLLSSLLLYSNCVFLVLLQLN